MLPHCREKTCWRCAPQTPVRVPAARGAGAVLTLRVCQGSCPWSRRCAGLACVPGILPVERALCWPCTRARDPARGAGAVLALRACQGSCPWSGRCAGPARLPGLLSGISRPWVDYPHSRADQHSAEGVGARPWQVSGASSVLSVLCPVSHDW